MEDIRILTSSYRDIRIEYCNMSNNREADVKAKNAHKFSVL